MSKKTKEIVKIVWNNQGSQWLHDHKEQIQERFDPIIDASMARLTGVTIRSILDGEEGNIFGEFARLTAQKIKEAVPEIPDHALDAAVSVCLKIMVEHCSDQIRELFKHLGIDLEEFEFSTMPQQKRKEQNEQDTTE